MALTFATAHCVVVDSVSIVIGDTAFGWPAPTFTAAVVVVGALYKT